jgi:hypothetical protein
MFGAWGGHGFGEWHGLGNPHGLGGGIWR